MSTYNRTIRDVTGVHAVEADIYCVLDAFNVTCPARAHAIKKILCAGQRGTKDTLTDLDEAIQSLIRARSLEADRTAWALVKPEDLKPPKKTRRSK